MFIQHEEYQALSSLVSEGLDITSYFWVVRRLIFPFFLYKHDVIPMEQTAGYSQLFHLPAFFWASFFVRWCGTIISLVLDISAPALFTHLLREDHWGGFQLNDLRVCYNYFHISNPGLICLEEHEDSFRTYSSIYNYWNRSVLCSDDALMLFSKGHTVPGLRAIGSHKGCRCCGIV